MGEVPLDVLPVPVARVRERLRARERVYARERARVTERVRVRELFNTPSTPMRVHAAPLPPLVNRILKRIKKHTNNARPFS